MNILEFDPQEFEEALEVIEEKTSDLKMDLECSLESLLFLGKNILSIEKEGLLDTAIFNIRLCYTYYSKIEDYKKLADIRDLVKMLENDKVKSIVDKYIVDEICINLN
jgi:hypothetical protein